MAGAAEPFNWSGYIIVGIPGALALIAVIVGRFFDRRQKRDESDDSRESRREPSWHDLVTENRSLRTEMSELSESFDSYREEQRAEKKKQDAKIEGLEVSRKLADRREVLLYQHTKALRDHILNELPPPPPTPHPELLDWFEQFEDTLNPLRPS